MGWVVFLMSMATLGGCSANSPTAPRTVSLGQEFELAPRQAGMVEGAGLTVTFEKVTSDSRCAVDVVCFWEGDALVVVNAVQPPRERAVLELHTSATVGPTQGRYGDFTVSLVGLRPQPRSTQTIEAEAYRLTLRVTR